MKLMTTDSKKPYKVLGFVHEDAYDYPTTLSLFKGKAENLGADAIVKVRLTYRPLKFYSADPVLYGTAIKYTNNKSKSHAKN